MPRPARRRDGQLAALRDPPPARPGSQLLYTAGPACAGRSASGGAPKARASSPSARSNAKRRDTSPPIPRRRARSNRSVQSCRGQRRSLYRCAMPSAVAYSASRRRRSCSARLSEGVAARLEVEHRARPRIARLARLRAACVRTRPLLRKFSSSAYGRVGHQGNLPSSTTAGGRSSHRAAGLAGDTMITSTWLCQCRRGVFRFVRYATDAIRKRAVGKPSAAIGKRCVGVCRTMTFFALEDYDTRLRRAACILELTSNR